MTHESWAPVPIDMPTPGVAVRARRFARTSTVLARHMAPALARVALRRQPKGIAIAAGARRACEELGATYVKFAQLVASAPAVVSLVMRS